MCGVFNFKGTQNAKLREIHKMTAAQSVQKKMTEIKLKRNEIFVQ